MGSRCCILNPFFVFSYLQKDYQYLLWIAIQLRPYSSFYKRKTDYKTVNIFRKHSYRLTISLSTHCKTYCFAFQKRLFCTVKA